jgi:hypothetical protein
MKKQPPPPYPACTRAIAAGLLSAVRRLAIVPIPVIRFALTAGTAAKNRFLNLFVTSEQSEGCSVNFWGKAIYTLLSSSCSFYQFGLNLHVCTHRAGFSGLVFPYCVI